MNNIDVQRPNTVAADTLVDMRVHHNATMTRLAEIISNVTAPPFLAVPTFILLGLQQGYVGSNHNVSQSISVALLCGVILPIVIVGILLKLGKIDSVHIPRRDQRPLPFSLSLIGYIFGYGLLRALDGPRILAAIMLAYAVNGAIIMVITFWWKISVHATGVGGPLAALTYTFGLVILPLFLLIPLVSWARVHLRAHTPAQVIAGACVGIGLTLVQFALLFPPLGLI